ncbi:MAG: cyclic nucleotide-binding domain-containing protein [Alphaproteobacteria bacterium]|nr:cyclic nucleotide-binding domain-containing protein [Alphaproteobacteria bacterium]
MLGPAQVKEILGKNALFKGCTDSTLDEIAGVSKELKLEKGQVIYRPGDDAVFVYVLLEGIVTFLNQSGLEFLNVQREMDRSMVFGWIALVPDHGQRIGTAQLLEDSRVLALDGERLKAILDKDTESGYAVMQNLSSMIASTFAGKR